MPECSVIVITHNDVARLPRAVRSALDQTLRDLEVIISDDGSTDGTPETAAALQRADPRVRYLRREVNSGGCGAPRNDALDLATAPYTMFLDSDDTLPRHACKSLLAEVERTGADFVSGQIARLYERDGRLNSYYPHLFARRRVVEGIRADPELFFDSFATNKLFRTDFLRAHDLRFPEDLHYEDHIFTTALYCAARRFAVVPWVTYHWHRAENGTSISLSIDELENVRHRLAAARISDEILRSKGFADLVPDRQYRFLRQDLRVYLNPLPTRDAAWVAAFAALVRPYLAGLAEGVLDRVEPMARVCCHLILAGRVEDLRVAARSLNGPKAPPRTAVRQGDRTYWGTQVSPGMDITDLHLAELPYSVARLRHEITEISAHGSRLRLAIRTYDPFGVLNGFDASLRCGRFKVPLDPRPVGEGGYLSEIEIDLSGCGRKTGAETGAKAGSAVGAKMPAGTKADVRVAFTRSDGRTTSDRVLVDPTMEPITLRAGGREVTVAAEGTAARLRLTSRWIGIRSVLPALRRIRIRVIRTVSTPKTKLWAYKALIRILPVRPNLALFEADCGRGYTGSPRAVYEEMRRRGLPVDAVWSVVRRRSDYPRDATLVRRGSWRYLWTMARAGIWVDSHGFPLEYPKPRGTRYLQTWHGQGIKTIGFDAPDLRADFARPRETWRAAVDRWDALVCPSTEFSRVFVPSNGYTGPLLRYGTPRCDALVRGRTPEGLRERLEIPPDRKVLLYAPTYRDQAKYSGRSIRVDLPMLAGELAQEWVLLLRTHPVERFAVPQHVRHFVRPAGAYPEINDLMLISDALLTDYSSVMCDYALTGRPMLFFIDDWEEYRLAERGVYHDLPEIAPGPCVTTTAELVARLRDLPQVHRSYAAKYAAFRRLWCHDEQGTASAQVVEHFFGKVG